MFYISKNINIIKKICPFSFQINGTKESMITHDDIFYNIIR